MDPELLRSLGLTDKETRLYLALLKEPALSPSDLAKRVGMKRTTAYSMARTLIEKGFLVEDATKRPRVFSPASPTEIMTLVDQEKRRLSQREGLLKQFSEELAQNIASTTYPVPKIRFIEEAKLEDFLYHETPRWLTTLDNLQDPVWWGFQDHTFVDAFKEWIDWQWQKTPEHVILQLLTNQSEVEVKLAGKYPHRRMRFWQESENFISTTWVIEDSVVVLNTRQHPFYLYEINDALLAHDFRELFKNIWRETE